MYRFFLTVAITAALAVPAGVWLDGWLRAARQQEQAEFELRVERELDKPISLGKIASGEPTVLDVLRHVAKLVDLPVVYRAKLLEEIDVGTKEINLPDAKLSFRSILGILSRHLPLDYYADGRRLVITRSDDAGGRLTTGVYPLPQLAGPEQPFGADTDTWIEVLSVVIEPDSWDGVGGPAEIIPVPGALIIRQSRRAHDRLQQFFRRLEMDSPTPDAQADYLSSFSPEERRIHAVLEAPCDFQCTSAPLYEVIEELSLKHRIPIVFCQRQLEESAIDLKKPMTLKMEGASLRSVLRSLFDQDRLTYVIRDDVLQVTTTRDTESFVCPVVFDVRDLVKVKEGIDFDSLIELITTTVDPSGWDDRSGPGPLQEMIPGWLAFSETGHIHEDTAVLLTRLRAALRARSGGTDEAAKQTPAERKIAAALERNIKLDYQGLGLQEVVADLAEQTGVNMRLDNRNVFEGKGNVIIPVVCHLPPLPLKTALQRLLEGEKLAGENMAWCIRDESLVLTTQVDANSQHELLILDVHDLVEPPEDENSLGDSHLVGIVESIVRPRDWDGAASLHAFRSLLVCSAPRRVNDVVERLVEDLRKYRHNSLLARRTGTSNIAPLPLDGEQAPSRSVLLARIYPVDDLLGAEGPAALVDLQNAIKGMVAKQTWADVGGPGRIVAVPPAGLLVANTQKGHDSLQQFLDELRKHLVPDRPHSPWLTGRDMRRHELEQALSSRESVLHSVTRMKELRTAVERAIKKDVALGLFYLVREFEKIPEAGPTAAEEGSSLKEPTVKEQLAALGLAVVDTDVGLKLMDVTDDVRLAFFDVRKLLSRENPLDEEEICTLLDSPFPAEVRYQGEDASPACYRGWIVVRSFEQRLGQLEEMVRWLEQHPEAPRALEVRERMSRHETDQLIRQLLDSKSAAEQLYLAFVLQFTLPPEDGLEELAARVEALAREQDLLLAIRLKESLCRWVSVLPSERVERVLSASHSPFVRLTAVQTLASRLSLRDPTGEVLEKRTDKMIAARADLAPEEIAALREALSKRHSPPIQRTAFEAKDRSGASLLQSSAPLAPWRQLRGRTQSTSEDDPFGGK